MDQLSLQNVLVSAQIRAPLSTRLVTVGKTPFYQLSASPQQALAILASHPLPVLVHRLLFLGLAYPVTATLLLLLRNVAPYLKALHTFHDGPAVVALVGH